MSTDPTMDAALRYVRPGLLRRLWSWYQRVTGYAPRREPEYPRYQSTVLPGGERCTCLLCNPRRLP